MIKYLLLSLLLYSIVPTYVTNLLPTIRHSHLKKKKKKKKKKKSKGF